MIVPTVVSMMPLFDGKIDRSFNVAMFFTMKALTIKGVNPATIAKTQSALNKQHLQQAKEIKHAMPVANPRWIVPSFPEPRVDSVARAILAPITRSASLPFSKISARRDFLRSRKSLQAEDNLLHAPPLEKSISMPSTTGFPSRDSVMHVRTNRFLTIA